MDKKILTKVLAGTLAFTLTFANVMFLEEAIAASIELEAQDTAVKKSKIQFDAYFKEEESQTHTKEINIAQNKDILYVQMRVDEGYLKEGTITLEDSNFKLVPAEEKSKSIQDVNIEEGLVTLKQIDDGESVVIEIPIQMNTDSNFVVQNLNKTSKITLNGTYVNVKGREIKVSKTIDVLAKIKSEAKASLTSEVLKYVQFDVNGKKGVILQTKIKSSIENNIAPVKQTEIEIEIPIINKAKPSKVEISEITTKATNGKMEKILVADKDYKLEEGKATIIIENEEKEDGTISWEKECQDEILLTCIYDEKAIVEAEEISLKANSKITTYIDEETEVEGKLNQKIALEEKVGDVVTFGIKSDKEKIEKGYMLVSGAENNTYVETWSSNVGNIELVDSIVLENEERYIDLNSDEHQALPIYTYTKISSEEFNKILGKEGYINIYDKEGQKIATLDKDNLEYKYEEEVTYIKVETSKPQVEGILNIENGKEIKNAEYERAQTESFVKLKTRTVGTVVNENKQLLMGQDIKEIELAEPKTVIEPSISHKALSTSSVNEKVEIKVTLNTVDGTKNLYKNPKIIVELPSYIKELTDGKIGLLYETALKITKSDIYRNDKGNNVIEIQMEGEQTEFNTSSVSNGATILMYANIDVDELAPNIEENIKVYVSNENMSLYDAVEDEMGIFNIPVRYAAQSKIITRNTISGYNEENAEVRALQKAQAATIKPLSEGKNATVKIDAVNSLGSSITNVKILGRVPFEGNKEIVSGENLNSKFTANMISAISSTYGIEAENIEIYYSANGEATIDMKDAQNGWTKEVNDYAAVKSYMIVLGEQELPVGARLSFEYGIQIPENLGGEVGTSSTFAVYYNEVEADVSGEIKEASAGTLKVESANIVSIITEKAPEPVVTEEPTPSVVDEGNTVEAPIEETNTVEVPAEKPEVTNTVTPSNVENTVETPTEGNTVTTTPESGANEITQAPTGTPTNIISTVKPDNGTISSSAQAPAEERPTEELTPFTSNDIDVSILMTTSGKALQNEAEIKEGQYVDYLVTMKNKSEKTLVYDLEVAKENGTFYGTYVYGYTTVGENPLYVYGELKDEILKEKITIKPGQTTTYKYSIVANKATKGSNLVSKISAKQNGQSVINNVTTTNKIIEGELKLNITYNRTEQSESYGGADFPILITATNITDKELSNVEVTFEVPEDLEYRYNTIYEEDSSYDRKDDSSRTLKYYINSIPAGKSADIYILTMAKDIKVEQEATGGKYHGTDAANREAPHKDIEIMATAKSNGIDYSSNIYGRKIYPGKTEITAKMSGSVLSEYVEEGQEFEYILEIENLGTIDEIFLMIEDFLPDSVQANSYKIFDDEEGKEIGNGVAYNALVIGPSQLKAKSHITVKVQVTVVANLAYVETIKNTARITGRYIDEIMTNEVTYKIKDFNKMFDIPEQSENPEATVTPGNGNGSGSGNENGDDEQNKPQTTPSVSVTQGAADESNEANGSFYIDGNVWNDTNSDGKRDGDEKPIRGMTVMLMNNKKSEFVKDSKGKEISTKTNENGYYKFNGIKSGEYIVVFMYDGTLYTPTTYQKSGVDTSSNSDAIEGTIRLNGVETKVAVTDIIRLGQANVEHIDLGLITAKKFDLKLEKSVSTVIVQNSQGTKTYNFQNDKLAKIEIPSKYMKGSNITIEYKISVTNEGDVSGNIDKIVDNIPNGLEFSSDINHEWYKGSDGSIYTTELANTEIKPGETKTVTLVLTKTLKEEAAEIMNNTAEIAEAHNAYGLDDIDSTPGDNEQKDDDFGAAELIITIKTGLITYTLIILGTAALVGVLGSGIYLIKRKVLKGTI